MTSRTRPTPLVRMVLEAVREDGTKVLSRVVLIEDRKWAWLADLAERSWPEPRDLSLLTQQMAAGSMVPVPDPHARAALAADGDLERHGAKSQSRWDLIEPLVTGEGMAALVREAHRTPLLKDHARATGTTYTNLVKLLRRFWARGMTPVAVATSYGNCGGPGRKRTLGASKPGARRSRATGTGIPITVTERRRLEVAANYHLDGGMTQKDALQKVIEQFYAGVSVDTSGRIRVTVPDAVPTIAQFRYYLKTHHPAIERRRRSKGQNAFDLEDRALPGRADDGVQGPGSSFQLDATIADTYLVSSFDRTRIVGRPVIYFVVDVWSRLIVGLYVGFEGPSWLGAISALINAVTPKVEFCRSLGIDIDEAEWPRHHLPASVLGDRSEMLSVRNGKNLEKYHQVSIANTAARRGDLKSIVERRFGIVQSTFKAFIPGYVRPDFGERGADDYRRDATLTLEEFTKIIVLSVIQHNRTPPTRKSKPAAMVAEGATAAPTSMWAWGLRNRSGALSVADVDSLALSLLPTTQARITARGIRLFGAYYLSDEVMGLGWFAHARHEESTREVSYDPRCMDAIYLRDPKLAAGYARLELRRDDPWRGKTLAEVEQNEQVSAATEAAAAHGLLEQAVASKVTVDRIISDARSATEAARGGRRPTPKDIRGIRANKAEEKDRRRRTEALRPGTATAPAASDESVAEEEGAPHEATTPKPVDRLERLRQLRQKRGSDD